MRFTIWNNMFKSGKDLSGAQRKTLVMRSWIVTDSRVQGSSMTGFWSALPLLLAPGPAKVGARGYTVYGSRHAKPRALTE